MRGATQPDVTHDPADLVVTDVDVSAVAQFRLDPEGTVGATRLAMNLGDLPSQNDLPKLPR